MFSHTNYARPRWPYVLFLLCLFVLNGVSLAYASAGVSLAPAAAPIAEDDVYTTTEDIPLLVSAPGVLSNDSDPDLDVITPTLMGPPANGTVTINPDGSFVYTPTADFEGTDSFTYLVYDNSPFTAQAYWPFDDGVSPTADVTGNGHNGTVLNGAAFTTDMPAIPGNNSALAFDGVDDRVEVTGIDLANQSFTIAFWAKRDTSGGADFAIGQGSGTNSTTLHIGFRNTNLFTCAFWNNDLNTTAAYTDTDWHHWACTYDAVTKQRNLYRDGELVASGLASANYQGSGTLTIGSRGTNDPFDGSMDDVRVYIQALPQFAIEEMMAGEGVGTGQTAGATVTLNVTAVNDAPIAVDDVYTTTQGIPFQSPLIEQNLLTLFSANNGQDGNMFNITAGAQDLTITAFDINVNTTGSIETILYYNPGGYAGSEQTPADWTLVDTFMVEAMDQNNATHMDISSAGGLTIPAGETYGIYLSVTNTGLNFRYTNVASPAILTDGYITYTSGTGNPYPFGSSINLRNWNGRVYYEIDGGVLANDSDAETVAFALDVELENEPMYGSVELQPTGNFTYTPPITFTGVDTFTYIASDGVLTDTATVSITVVGGCFVETTGDNITDYSGLDSTALQQAIDNANPGDLLKVAGNCIGVQGLAGGLNTAYFSKDLTVEGGYLPNNWLVEPDPAIPTVLDADGGGGTVYVANSSQVTLNYLTITGGNFTEGGGVYVTTGSTLTLTNSLITGNSATHGSGLYNNGGVVTITHSTLSENITSVDGTIWNNGQLYLEGNTFTDNSAVRGGAIYAESDGTLTALNNTLAYNTANEGGAIHNRGNMTLIHNTLAHNTADVGSAVHQWGGNSVLQLFHNILAYNLNGNFQCFNDGGTLQNSLQNLITDGSCGATLTADPLLGALENNGGATETMLPQAFSPAIDFTLAGSYGCGTVYTSDQRGYTRPVDGYCDIGAIELETNFVPTAVADSYSTVENTALVITTSLGVLSNDTDGDWDTLIAELSDDVSHGTLALSPDGSFTYTPAADFVGTDWFTYQAGDEANISEVVTVTLVVQAENDAPVVEAGADQETTEGASVNFEGSYSDPGRLLNGGTEILWDFGDGSTAAGTLTPTHSFADNGVYTVTLTVTDSLGAAGSDFLLVTVTNVNPTLEPISDITVTLGTTVTLAAAYDDVGAGDSHTATINWGDGESEPGTVASGELSGSHLYDTAGVYTVTVTLADDDGGEATQTFVVTVTDEVIPPTGYIIFLPVVVRP